MSYIQHSAIVFTSFKKSYLKPLWKLAKEKAPTMVTNMVKSPINSWFSFFLAPDGSSEGWEDSNVGDRVREELVKEARKISAIDFCEILYGGDGEGYNAAHIVAHNLEE